MSNRLTYDVCRCAGVNCARKDSCLRHAAMWDRGPCTPWTDRFCQGDEDSGFIPIEVEA